jgi:hypothetical protein
MTPKDIKVLHRACQPADRGISSFVLPTLWDLITDTSEEIPLRSAMTVRLDQLEDKPTASLWAGCWSTRCTERGSGEDIT